MNTSGFWLVRVPVYRLHNYLLGKGGYVIGSIGLSVCLSVDNITQKIYEWIGMKFYGRVLGSTMEN